MSGDRPVFDHLEDDALRTARAVSGWFHHTPAAPAAATPKENTMVTPDSLRQLASDLETLGDDASAKAQAILGKPETAEGFQLLHQLTALNIPPSEVTQALGGLRAQVMAYTRAQAQQAAAGQPA